MVLVQNIMNRRYIFRTFVVNCCSRGIYWVILEGHSEMTSLTLKSMSVAIQSACKLSESFSKCWKEFFCITLFHINVWKETPSHLQSWNIHFQKSNSIQRFQSSEHILIGSIGKFSGALAETNRNNRKNNCITFWTHFIPLVTSILLFRECIYTGKLVSFCYWWTVI